MNGKRTSRGVPARALEQAREQLLRYRRFKTLSADLTEVSAKICHIKIQSAEPAGKEAEEKTVDSESLPN